MNVDEEIGKLKDEITRLGQKQPDGSISVKFGKLFDETADIFEALGGTLRAAKKRKLITFGPEILFQGRDNDVDIILLSSSTLIAKALFQLRRNHIMNHLSSNLMSG